MVQLFLSCSVQFSVYHLLQRLSFTPLHGLCTFVESFDCICKSLFLGSRFSNLYVCLMPVPHCLHYHGFVVSLKLGSMRLPTSFFLFKIVLAFWDLLNFEMDFICKSVVGILIRIALNL